MIIDSHFNGTIDGTIGILTCESKDLLGNCLDSIFSNQWKYHYEIIVVDNGSRDKTNEMLKMRYSDVKVIENINNRGVAPARNQILQTARGRYSILIDVDTYILPDSFDTLIKVMDKNPDAAVGGPKLLYGDHRLQLSCRPFPSLMNIICEGTFLKDYFPNNRFVKDYTMEDWSHDDVAEIDWMYGACLILRRSCMEAIGGFDENFFYLYEDIDLCFRAKEAGFKVLYIPHAEVIHYLEREGRSVFHSRINSHIKSIFRYLFKDYYAWLD